MDDHQDVQNQFTDAEGIRVTCSCFRTFKELKQTLEAQQAVESKKWSVADSNSQIQQISWEDGADVQFTLYGPNIHLPQPLHVFHHQSLIQETCIYTDMNG